jgi:hypothetical protein
MELLGARSPIAEPARPLALPAAAAGLRVNFCGVRFAYPSRPAQVVLQGLDFTIEAGQTVALVGESVAVSVAVITVTVMVIMSFIGLVIPKVFEGWGPYLMAGLTLLIVAQFAQIISMLLGFSEAVKMPILSWIGITLFLGFVAYDWASALKYEYTLDNAIKASGVLGVDFANIYAYIGEFMSGADTTRKTTSGLTSGGGEVDLADSLEIDD